MIEMQATDPVTGLPTRSQCLKCFAHLAETQAQFGMVLLDIDRFQRINAQYGHHEGDQKLGEIASLIKLAAPKEAEIFRCGGDEFVILLNGLSMAEVVSVATQIKNIINHQFADLPALISSYMFPDRSHLSIQSPLSVSCGVAFYPVHGSSLEDLLKAADSTMYLAGKNLQPGGVLAVADLFCLETPVNDASNDARR
jgi:diguanylate cyclase (GGDEF)-like protein